ncbi:hypothetical protein MWU38_03550 [Qipengyuania sp. S6317L1]|uniref:hypothetical protein n=1 Tax=Qipengyuania sp. S6317L1 TaxID=2926410 RepID=UPI001FF4E3EE|nr:hypothetical protein [Qipengyuania sp. S6317L1]MCK0098451.1 hypothetical protein [Qipengyuania sp. S6317L1]
MDVQDLAPALLALAEIAKTANKQVNGDRASIKVLVNADTEQKCFQLDLSLIQSWMDQASMLIGKDNVATARQIAEIIGLAGPPAGGLFWLYKRIYGKPREDGEDTTVSFEANEATGTTIININGDGNSIEVSNQTAKLAQDPRVLQHVKTVLEPLHQPDYEDFTILTEDKPLLQIDREEARHIKSRALPLPSETEPESFVSMVDGQVEIVTAQYKGSAQWGLWWTGRTRQMKIDDERWLERFQNGDEPDARPGAWLDVTMEITQPRDKKSPPSFLVKHVKQIIPPPDQDDLFE